LIDEPATVILPATNLPAILPRDALQRRIGVRSVWIA